MAEITPMMKQYLEIKEQNKDSILFFRLGDFYEMFNEDAKLASRELDLTLTTRDRGKAAEDQTPMCGIPYHSSDAYIARLIAKGYKVAICEQTEDPAKAKGLVKREVVKVLTPGTITDGELLDEGTNNYICSFYARSDECALCFADVSTGEARLYSFSDKTMNDRAIGELSRFMPSELLINEGFLSMKDVSKFVRNTLKLSLIHI